MGGDPVYSPLDPLSLFQHIPDLFRAIVYLHGDRPVGVGVEGPLGLEVGLLVLCIGNVARGMIGELSEGVAELYFWKWAPDSARYKVVSHGVCRKLVCGLASSQRAGGIDHGASHNGTVTRKMEVNGVNPSINDVNPPTARASTPTVTLFPETVLSHAVVHKAYHFDVLEECDYIDMAYLMSGLAASESFCTRLSLRCPAAVNKFAALIVEEPRPSVGALSARRRLLFEKVLTVSSRPRLVGGRTRHFSFKFITHASKVLLPDSSLPFKVFIT